MIESVTPYCSSPHHILVILFPMKRTWPLCEVLCKFAYLLIQAIKSSIVASVLFC